MSRDVIPSIYAVERADSTGAGYDSSYNNSLRFGEVIEILNPDHPRNLSKKFIEYKVSVSHKENNTTVTKYYENVNHINSLAGMADKLTYTLRAAPKQINNAVSPSGTGSKVLILCIGAEQSSAVIIGGIRDSLDADDPKLGHNFHFNFNGMDLAIKDDGSLSLEYKGKTLSDGKIDPSVNTQSVGTKMDFSADGSWKVATKDAKQYIEINHSEGKTKVFGDNDVTVHANAIHLGNEADQHAVLGDVLVDKMGQLIDLITKQTSFTSTGITSRPINSPAFLALKAQLESMLSHQTFLKREA